MSPSTEGTHLNYSVTAIPTTPVLQPISVLYTCLQVSHTCIVDGIYDSVPCCVRAVGTGNTVRSRILSQRVVLKEVAASKVSYSSSTRDKKVTVVQEESI